ncbi:MAG: exodeoxyribonuclease VII large subunit [Gammaproteobacteria bacterium]|nr:exodeoxyribonuclease VII large subunit [Gammaproteobacteria bacterium]MCH9744898.1 exodeoxyribonuclease VII large subunit [Gammaproteobacteria bacterium]
MQQTAIDTDVFTVSQLNATAKSLLEEGLRSLWILGEISNLSCPSSGHVYFSLKDQNAQVRCALFRMSRRNVEFTPENGQQVLVHARVSLYEARGDYQLIINRMQLAGDGALQIAFEKLKKQLDKEGLFDPQHKQALPEFPQCIGVVTSATGAALRDILRVLQRRFSALKVIVYPSLVQGEQAAAQIASAIEQANQRNECDALIVARGGGSLEDLWPFNEEVTARAIFASHIPIVTGVGHEIDFTIADFVADTRAATPSAAAEIISPNAQEWQQYLSDTLHLLHDTICQSIQLKYQQLTHLQKRLRHPGDKCREQMQQLDHLEKRLLQSMKHQLEHYNQKLQQTARTLDAISPLQTLQRGYAILQDESDAIIKQCNDTQKGADISAKLANGKLKLKVQEVLPE